MKRVRLTSISFSQKSWRSFSPITVCIIAQCQCRTGGEAGGTCPYPHEEAAVSILKNFRAFICTVMVWWCLGWFGVFRGRRFSKRNLAHYLYGDGLVVFGVVWGVLGRFGVFRSP